MNSNSNSNRRKFSWTEKQLDKLKKVQEILKVLEEYKPLTLRQVYYQMVGKGFIENKISEYGMLSGLLKWARIDGHINWDDIEDRVRVYHDLTGWSETKTFIRRSLKSFLEGYQRDLLQTQDKYIEIWIEKDALSSIFIRVAERYTVPVVVCRGFSSISFLHDFKKRLGCQEAHEVVMLYFGDFDPSGMEMLTAMQTTLNEELGVNGVFFKRVALMEDDIQRYKLPNNPNALKKSDSRAKKHINAYGLLAVELDALGPDVLEKKIEDAIESELDIGLFNKEIKKHNNDLNVLNKFKRQITKRMEKYVWVK